MVHFSECSSGKGRTQGRQVKSDFLLLKRKGPDWDFPVARTDSCDLFAVILLQQVLVDGFGKNNKAFLKEVLFWSVECFQCDNRFTGSIIKIITSIINDIIT